MLHVVQAKRVSLKTEPVHVQSRGDSWIRTDYTVSMKQCYCVERTSFIVIHPVLVSHTGGRPMVLAHECRYIVFICVRPRCEVRKFIGHYTDNVTPRMDSSLTARRDLTAFYDTKN